MLKTTFNNKEMGTIGPSRWYSGKEFLADAGDAGDASLIPGSGRSPGGGHDNLHSSDLPGESHGQRSLVGYSPWGHKESDMTD